MLKDKEKPYFILTGGPEQIRTDGQAVAVPCLTTWLQGQNKGFSLSLFHYTKLPKESQT